MLSGTPLLMRCNLNITANLTQYWNQIRYMFLKADIFMIDFTEEQLFGFYVIQYPRFSNLYQISEARTTDSGSYLCAYNITSDLKYDFVVRRLSGT